MRSLVDPITRLVAFYRPIDNIHHPWIFLHIDEYLQKSMDGGTPRVACSNVTVPWLCKVRVLADLHDPQIYTIVRSAHTKDEGTIG